LTNSAFDGPGADEDFRLAQLTGRSADRYKFRTSPLRNVALQPAFFHNGAFTTLEEAIRHHLDPRRSALAYTPAGRLPADLAGPTGPVLPPLSRLDDRVRRPINMNAGEFADLVAFVRDGLLDPRARPERLKPLTPAWLPSRLTPLQFQN
jgi:cytochrome c peroxidase